VTHEMKSRMEVADSRVIHNKVCSEVGGLSVPIGWRLRLSTDKYTRACTVAALRRGGRHTITC
jgi:hypothetical protein